MELEGRTAIITGGAGGMGHAIGLALATDGANIVVADMDIDAANRVAAEISELGVDTQPVLSDVASKSSVDEMTQTTLDRFGHIDILINNAGVQHIAPIVDFPELEWHRLIEIMLSGTFFCTQAVLPSMIEQQSGRIINISSVLGKVGSKYKSAYVAAKHGIVGLKRATALEVAEDGITANAICPGVTGTSIVANQLQGLAAEYGITKAEVLEKVFYPDVPQKRLLQPNEIADMATYLASDKAYAITGQAINVSAGWVMS